MPAQKLDIFAGISVLDEGCKQLKLCIVRKLHVTETDTCFQNEILIESI